METQPRRRTRATRAIASATIAFTLVGSGVACVSSTARRPTFSLVAAGEPGSDVRVYRSLHFVLYTTVLDAKRVADVVATLEASYDAYAAVTGVRPASTAKPMSVFLFARRDQWEAFTRARTGDASPIYLKLVRGGYTYGTFCAVLEQGERDTLTVLAHEGFHLFVATHFQARPPPFVEEGLATLFENVSVENGVASVRTAESASRAGRLAGIDAAHTFVPLRTLLAMHAGNVIGLGGVEVDAFYAQAWAFVRFLREGDAGAHRPAFERLLADSAAAGLSSDRLADNPALVERYLGVPLESIEPAYQRFAAALGNEPSGRE